MTDSQSIVKTNFDGAKYVAEYLSRDDFEEKWLVEEFYHHIFSQKKVSGKTLLDVGSGPTVRVALSASAYIPEIYLSDLMESNLEIIKKWLQNAPDALDFSKVFKFVANFEGKDNIKYLEERVRKSVKEVMICDIYQDNPLNPRPIQQFDIVTTSFCIESSPDYEDYLKAWRNLAALTRSGGYIVSVGLLDCSYYSVGTKKLPTTNTSETLVKNAITEAGLKILEFDKIVPKVALVDCDWKGAFNLLAKKC